MKLPKFVCLTAVILCGWLALTFVTEVPTKRYPKLDKQVRADGDADPEQVAQLVATGDETSEILHVSVSQ